MGVYSGVQVLRSSPMSTALLTEISGYVQSHSAWSVVHSGAVAYEKPPVACEWVVFKCDGAQNDFGVDFHVCLLTHGSRGRFPEIYMLAGEGYISGSAEELGFFTRPVPGVRTMELSPSSDGSVGGGVGYPLFSTDPEAWGQNVGDLWNVPLGVGNRSYLRYVVHVTNSTLNLHLSPPSGAGGSSQQFTSVGLFQSLVPQEPMPLFMGLNNTARVSRMPFVVAAQPKNWMLERGMAPGLPWSVTTGYINAGGDLLHSGRPISSRMAVQHAGRPDTHGGLRGLFYDLYQFGHFPPPNIGDIIVIDGNPCAVMHTYSTQVGVTTATNLNRP